MEPTIQELRQEKSADDYRNEMTASDMDDQYSAILAAMFTPAEV